MPGQRSRCPANKITSNSRAFNQRIQIRANFAVPDLRFPVFRINPFNATDTELSLLLK